MYQHEEIKLDMEPFLEGVMVLDKIWELLHYGNPIRRRLKELDDLESRVGWTKDSITA